MKTVRQQKLRKVWQTVVLIVLAVASIPYLVKGSDLR